ncbi:MAG: UDP-N-acetylmuramoyl-L-alanine--D-glutamate ligase [Anaerolineae bacterium]|nr:UDP-N-acetylmuramoyl-L-alanine--D-glutamate ligase [Anaerolineae bacterium]
MAVEYFGGDGWYRTGIGMMMTQDRQQTRLDALTGKRLLILGLARQGKALARFAVGRGAQVIVSDLRSAETLHADIAELADLPVELVLGNHPLTLLDDIDVLAISGGVPADAPLVVAARDRGISVTNDSLEFLLRCPAPIVGITGAAGKSTTTSLVGAMGTAAGRPTWVGGNIGRPLLADLDAIRPNDLVVQELSSFQLEIWTHSPPIATILNITPNHLDRHKTMAVYTQAKANILRFQPEDGIAVLPYGDLAHLEGLVQGRLRHFCLDEPVADGAFARDGAIWLRNGEHEQRVCALDDIQLRGEHNVRNVLAAVVLAASADISAEAISEAIRTFTGIPHRLELVAKVDGVAYVNDSIATAPERAIAAVRAYDEPLILLTGGRDKDLDWETWLEVVAGRAKHVILFGELAGMLEARLAGVEIAFDRVVSLADAVMLARQLAEPGDVVLLSPGGTSFDAYSDFAQRGDEFRQLVRNW